MLEYNINFDPEVLSLTQDELEFLVYINFYIINIIYVGLRLNSSLSFSSSIRTLVTLNVLNF